METQTMKTQTLCQSCGMPLDDPEFFGTETDGSTSTDYCLDCYVDGFFRDPDMTLDEMKEMIISDMERMQESSEKTDNVVKNLEKLKRWN